MDMLLQIDLADRQHDRLFAFEADFVADLRCIPMAVRLKLDRVGIKMSLKQWARTGHVDRQRLLKAPCSRPEDVMAFEKLVRGLIRESAVGQVVLLAADAIPRIPRRAPSADVIEQCRRDGIAPPDSALWSSLSTLEKFVLVKLSRAGHDNANFPAAWAEITGIQAVAA